MIDYPFDEERACIDKEGFETLGRYFPLVNNLSKNSKVQGFCFQWDNGWEMLRRMSVEDLCQLSPSLFAYGYGGFSISRGDLSRRDGFSPDELLRLMKERGITRDIFLEYAGNFEFKSLGPESASIIAVIAYDLEPDNGFPEQSSYISNEYGRLKKSFKENSERLQGYNKGKESPFTLDQILTFDNEPACLRFSDTGKLYVLDTQAVLHEFTGAEKTGEWALWRRNGMPNIDEMSLMGGFQSFPNIAVAGDHVFVVTGEFDITRYNLSHHDTWKGKVAIDAEVYTGQGNGRMVNHDVVIKDKNVFVSMSDERGWRRYIGQAVSQGKNIQFKTIYEGRFPVSDLRSNLEDHTLRLDIHKGHLFFPRKTGISLYRGMRPDGQKPKEMLEGYVDPQGLYNPVNPITKFSFGDNFMVAQAKLQGFEIPMLCIFRSVYEQREGTGLVPAGIMPAPDRLELEYIGYSPKLTGITLMNASLSAHGDTFAMTNSSFKKVFVYRMKEAKE